MKARLPNASVKTLPLYEGLGSLRYGYLPAFAQSKLPESTITPPTELPCPLRNLVVDWTTMSAPCSIGRHKTGDASVLSTISGTPASCAIVASAARSATTDRKGGVGGTSVSGRGEHVG